MFSLYLSDKFTVFSSKLVKSAGSIWSFVWASVSIVMWLLTGPIFHFSDTWQLVANTATNFITFLMVFIIQNSQNRDTRALHLKMDEVIRALRHARPELVSIENLSDKELRALEDRLDSIGHPKHHRRRRGKRRVQLQDSV